MTRDGLPVEPVEPVVPDVTGIDAPTRVEAWLLELGLRAIQVEHCPVEACEACHPATSDDRRAA
jgi:hypothetical protein